MLQVMAIVFIVMVAALGWRLVANRKKPRHQAVSVARQGARTPYHCVEVRTGAKACAAARNIGHARFLPNEAPELPVSGCAAHQCTCSYVHHDDRRDDDRRHPYGQWANMLPKNTAERRSRADRRRSHERSFKPSIAR